MDRVRPFDPSVGEPEYGSLSEWANANPAIGQEGSIPPHQAWTHVIAELSHLIEHAGMTPSHEDLQQVRKAIQAILGEYPTIDQILSYNRVYPHVMTADNKLTVVDNGDGTVTLAADQSWVHRGLIPRSSNDLSVEDRTVSIPPDSTGHLRWRWNDGSPQVIFGDLADDQDYNPSELVDEDPEFDTGFDDMLICRIEREGSDPPEITALKNKRLLWAEAAHIDDDPILTEGGNHQTEYGFELDWARTPQASVVPRLAYQDGSHGDDIDLGLSGGLIAGGGGEWGPGEGGGASPAHDATWSRYRLRGRMRFDYAETIGLTMHARA